jgi:hypothetical protein
MKEAVPGRCSLKTPGERQCPHVGGNPRLLRRRPTHGTLKKAADCKNKVQLLFAKIKPVLERIRDNKSRSVAYFPQRDVGGNDVDGRRGWSQSNAVNGARSRRCGCQQR